jgi:hypothetical protein
VGEGQRDVAALPLLVSGWRSVPVLILGLHLLLLQIRGLVLRLVDLRVGANHVHRDRPIRAYCELGRVRLFLQKQFYILYVLSAITSISAPNEGFPKIIYMLLNISSTHISPPKYILAKINN